MRICLITPPALFLTTERVFMALGVLRVAAVLEQAGHKVDFLDLSGIENYMDVIDDYLDDSKVNTFGLSATTPQLPVAVAICRAIHERRPTSSRVILGGAHATAINAAYNVELSHGEPGRSARAMEKLSSIFDVLIAGDGELAISTAIWPDSPKLLNADDIDSPMFLEEWQIDDLPLPARHLVDASSYKYMIDGVPALSLVSQQGCPYKCGFCSGRSSPSMRCVRARSIENTIYEILHLYNTYGVRGFMLYDDELNLDDDRLMALMHRLIILQRDLKCSFRLRGFVRSNLFTDEQAEVMYRAGFRWIIVGFESGSQRMLSNMEKQADVKDNTLCMKIAKRNGLQVKAAMSIGHPGESRDTVEQTKDWLLKVQPESIDVSIITPYPGSLYYGNAVPSEQEGVWVYASKKHGDKLYMYDVDYTNTDVYYKGVPGNYRSHVFTDYLSADELIELRDSVARTTQESLGLPDLDIGFTKYNRAAGRLPQSVLRKTDDKEEDLI